MTDRGSMDAREKFGILYDGYNEECWWWEVTVVARKVVVIMIGAFLKGRSQILAALLTVATVMCMTAMKRPFVNNTLLNLEMVSLSLCFLTFWIGAMLLADRGNFVCLAVSAASMCLMWLAVLAASMCLAVLAASMCPTSSPLVVRVGATSALGRVPRRG